MSDIESTAIWRAQQRALGRATAQFGYTPPEAQAACPDMPAVLEAAKQTSDRLFAVAQMCNTICASYDYGDPAPGHDNLGARNLAAVLLRFIKIGEMNDPTVEEKK